MEWIYFVIIFFYILNAIHKATKKKQQEEQKVAAIKQMNRRVEARPVPPPEPKPVRSDFEHAAEAFSDIPLGDVMRFIDDKMKARQTRQEESSFHTVDYDAAAEYEPAVPLASPVTDREHSGISTFHSAEAMHSDLHDRSRFSSSPQFASATFDFGKKRRERIDFKLRGAELRKYVIVSEILGKPKALRKK